MSCIGTVPAISSKQKLESQEVGLICPAAPRTFHRCLLPLVTGLQNWHDCMPSMKGDNSQSNWSDRYRQNIQVAIIYGTCASKHKLIVAIGEWHQEEYNDTNKSMPKDVTNEYFRRIRNPANSDDASKIKFNAYTKKVMLEKIPPLFGSVQC